MTSNRRVASVVVLAMDAGEELLWHGSNKQFDPKKLRAMSHVGSRASAIDRVSGDDPTKSHVTIHGYRLKSGSKTVHIGGEDPFYGESTGSRNSDASTLADSMQDSGHIGEHEARHVIGHKSPAKGLGEVAKARGIHTVSYTNGWEGRGTKSHVVMDPSHLEHVRSEVVPRKAT